MRIPHSSGAPAGDGAAPTGRRIDRRTGLPGSRAVVGALLMALAAVGVFLAYADATGTPTTSFVVAAADLAPGAVIAATDLGLADLDLPEGTAARAFTSPDDLVGRVAVAPMAAGEVVQASAVSATRRVEAAHEVALVLPRAQVAVRRLQHGDRVDLFATAGDETRTLARGALVVASPGGQGGAIGQEREVEVVVAVPSGEAVAAVVHALRTGDVTVVRSTFAEATVDGPLRHRAGDPVGDDPAADDPLPGSRAGSG